MVIKKNKTHDFGSNSTVIMHKIKCTIHTRLEKILALVIPEFVSIISDLLRVQSEFFFPFWSKSTI